MLSNREKIGLVIVAALILYKWKKPAAKIAYSAYNIGATAMGYPRGIRNNNPGNILYNPGINWEGQTVQDSGGYAIFSSPLYGIRAMALDLYNVYTRDGLDTVSEIISRWAPPTDNNTAAYITDVSQRLGVNPNQPFNVQANLPALINAIIHHEEGQDPYSESLVAQAIQAAGV